MLVTIIIIAVLSGVSVILTGIEFRRITPSVFRCSRCGHQFERPAHRDYPTACPSCKAPDWAE